jgi:membrane-associated protein
MPYKKFLAFNIIGGCLWAIGLPLLGFFLGNVIPNIERYLATIVLGIVGITVILPIIHALANKHTREELKKIVSSLRSSKK